MRREKIVGEILGLAMLGADFLPFSSVIRAQDTVPETIYTIFLYFFHNFGLIRTIGVASLVPIAFL